MTRDREYFLAGMAVSHCRAANAIPVGAHEHREAAVAVYQAHRYRCLAVLVSIYRKSHTFR